MKKTTESASGVMLRVTVLIAAAAVLSAGMAQADWVEIGNTGNSSDDNGLGSVDYTYQISDHEVTIGEYTQAWPDGVGSGNENYWNDGGTESWDWQNYDRNFGTDAPAVNITLQEAKDYANWRTEQEHAGDSSYNMYASDGSLNYATRQDAIATGKRIYAVPTEDEWYKAAYYDPNKSGGAGYWGYTDGTDTVPEWGGADTSTESGWNYDGAMEAYTGEIRPWAVKFGTEEHNKNWSENGIGTYDMINNVAEYTESAEIYSSQFRDAAFTPDDTFNNANAEGYYLGMRVVAIPEPSSALLLGLGALAVAGFRRGRRS